MRTGWVLGLALVWTAGWAQTAVLPVRHRLPQELVQALSPMLEQNERLVAVPDGIWVQASPARIGEIAALVAALDRRLARLTITVLQTDRFTLEELNRRAELEAGESAQAEVKVYETRSAQSLGAKQRLTTLEGQPAFIAVGRELPVPVFRLFGPHAVGGIDYLPATTGFQVTPYLIDCRVRLTVSPWSRRPGGLGGELAVQAAEAVLEAPLGRWVELGVAGLDEELAGTERLAHRYVTQNCSARLFVRVDAEDRCKGERQ